MTSPTICEYYIREKMLLFFPCRLTSSPYLLCHYIYLSFHNRITYIPIAQQLGYCVHGHFTGHYLTQRDFISFFFLFFFLSWQFNLLFTLFVSTWMPTNCNAAYLTRRLLFYTHSKKATLNSDFFFSSHLALFIIIVAVLPRFTMHYAKRVAFWK